MLHKLFTTNVPLLRTLKLCLFFFFIILSSNYASKNSIPLLPGNRIPPRHTVNILLLYKKRGKSFINPSHGSNEEPRAKWNR